MHAFVPPTGTFQLTRSWVSPNVNFPRGGFELKNPGKPVEKQDKIVALAFFGTVVVVVLVMR